MPNIAVRLGLYIVDPNCGSWNDGWWPYLIPFSPEQLLKSYTDPYGNKYAGYANRGDYANKVKAAVNSLVAEGLYDANIGEATVMDEVNNCLFPLKRTPSPSAKATCQGFWSDLTGKAYATPQARAKAEAKLAAFFGRSAARGARSRKPYG